MFYFILSLDYSLGHVVGCYKDGFPRDLSHDELVNTTGMTLDVCGAHCASKVHKTECAG